jgi:hypothetical protein
MMAALEALDRALGPGAEDAVRVNVQGMLEAHDGTPVVARMKGAPGLSSGRGGERDEQRHEKMSC